MGSPAIVGASEYRARRLFEPYAGMNSLQAAADLTLRALEDAGLGLRDIDGLVVSGVHESPSFQPSTVAEYLGATLNYAGSVDLGGANPAAMVARAAAAVTLNEARVVVCVTPGWPAPTSLGQLSDTRRFGASSYRQGSPQAEFDIPFGHLGQNALYAMVAQRYAYEYGYDPRVLGRLVSHQRASAAINSNAIFHGKPVTEDDVLGSRMIARPIRLLEIVMPASGGAAVVVADATIAGRCRHRPAFVAGWAERLAHKSPENAQDLLHPPMVEAAARAFTMAGLRPAEIDAAQIYDCYAINVLMTLEAAGFCGKGDGFRFLAAHDARHCGDFPVNTNGGQLGMGQTGAAGGMTHLVEGFRQIAKCAGNRQVDRCDAVFVSGNGGIMSEQVALVLRGG